MRLFSKSLAIGLPASRVDAYLRRPDSVRVYWTTLSHPWVIEFTSRLQEDIFKHIVNIITSTSNFGVHTRPGRTNKEQIVEVTSKPKLQQMLRFCLGNEETSLKREFPGKGKTDIIIDRETLHC